MPSEAIGRNGLIANLPRALIHLAVITAGLELTKVLKSARP